jgi:hypothetical protein
LCSYYFQFDLKITYFLRSIKKNPTWRSSPEVVFMFNSTRIWQIIDHLFHSFIHDSLKIFHLIKHISCQECIFLLSNFVESTKEMHHINKNFIYSLLHLCLYFSYIYQHAKHLFRLHGPCKPLHSNSPC